MKKQLASYGVALVPLSTSWLLFQNFPITPAPLKKIKYSHKMHLKNLRFERRLVFSISNSSHTVAAVHSLLNWRPSTAFWRLVDEYTCVIQLLIPALTSVSLLEREWPVRRGCWTVKTNYQHMYSLWFLVPWLSNAHWAPLYGEICFIHALSSSNTLAR